MNSWLWAKFFGDAPVQLSAVGLFFLGIGAFIQIWEEWKTRGLTDTSYKSLLLIAFGNFCIAVSSFVAKHDIEIVIIAAGACLLSLYLVGLKLRDLYHTMRGTWGRKLDKLDRVRKDRKITLWDFLKLR